jgi:single-strand DNA-binding protein
MASVNKVILMGYVGKDPELRYMANGKATTSLSLATSRNWKDKQTGDKVEETEWHRLVFFERLAEVVGEYVSKGKPIYIEGRLKTRKWEDKSGADHYVTEVICDSLQLLGSKPDGERSERAPAPAPQPSEQRRQPATKTTGTGFDDLDDDIPF